MAGDMVTNVLVITPCVKLGPDTLRSIFTQTYAGSIDHHFTRHNDPKLVGLNIVAAYQRLRAIFLAGAYTHLWIVEDDLIVPPDALVKLLAVGADINYAVYCFRRGTPVVNIMRMSTDGPMTAEPAQWKRDFTAGRVVDCTGLGFGCTLIQRHVIERFEMRTRGGGGDADTCLALDAAAAGMTQRADLSVVCGHMRPDGTTLWPAAERPFYRKVGVSVPKLAKFRALEGLGYWNEQGIPSLFSIGDTGELDAELVESLAARGQVEKITP